MLGLAGRVGAAILAAVAAACTSPRTATEVAVTPTTRPVPLTSVVATRPPSTVPPPPTTSSTTALAPAATPAAPAVEGLLTFRGNATRTFYGTGPVPADPTILWRFPEEPMCSLTRADGPVPTEWCGTGWTGQPAVVEWSGGDWIVFGAFDRSVHFLDAATGARRLPDFPTGDLIKGSVTVDPDGYPLVYVGSRDNRFRIIATDRAVPTELWALPAEAVSPRLWNNDWDATALVEGGYLFEGGENSQFHVVRLNRSYGADGLVKVDAELAFHAPGWDDELLAALPDRNVSIEGSVALWEGVAYFANSGGLVQGWDVSGLGEGRDPERVFRFWMGDDVDATVVVDEDGMLYVAAEWERRTERARRIGQIVKLDPSRADPLLWSVADQPPPDAEDDEVSGVWATPAVHRDLLVVATNGGRLLGIDRSSGAVRWTKELPGPLWQSPVIVDDVLIEGDCHGRLHAYDLSDPAVDPPELWSVQLGGCIESTPAVWNGHVYVGTRDGYFYAIGPR